jgi:hypothetical protein
MDIFSLYKKNMGMSPAGRSGGRAFRSYCTGLNHEPVPTSIPHAKIGKSVGFVLSVPSGSLQCY